MAALRFRGAAPLKTDDAMTSTPSNHLPRRTFACLLLSLPLFVLTSTWGSQLSGVDANALWLIVHFACVPHQQLLSEPWPCDKVDLSSGAARGYAVLPNITNKTQVLVIPTARISGNREPGYFGRRRHKLLAGGMGGAPLR